MCTVTWMHQENGYQLFCNRDEKKTRPVALPPRVQSCAAVRFLAPVDPQSGGSWIAVNEFGVSICLLNGDPVHHCLGKYPEQVKSRGLIPPQLITAVSASECILHLQELALAWFAPFTVLVLQPDTPAIIAVWDGRRVAINQSADSMLPLTSSAFEPQRISKSRERRFVRRLREAGHLSAEVLRDFHSSRGERHYAFSSCMHREDAETVSFSRVIVNRDRIQFVYSPGPPCQSAAAQETVLGRAA